MTQARGGKARKGRWRRWLWRIPLLFVAVTVLQVVVLRFVDPPFSAFMAARQFQAWAGGDWDFRIAHEWRDTTESSSPAPDLHHHLVRVARAPNALWRPT